MTKAEAKEYINSYISHILQMVEYGNWFYSKIKSITDTCIDDLNNMLKKQKTASTKRVCSLLMAEIENRLSECENKISDLITLEAQKIAESENEWLGENVADVLGIKLDYAKSDATRMLIIPVATAGVIGEYGITVSQRLQNIYKSEIMNSYVTGSDFEDLEKDYEPRLNTFERNLEIEAESLGETMPNQYDRLVYARNKTKIKGYIWNSILDTSTCAVCGSLSGERFDDVSKAPLYPHLRCRCFLMPYSDGVEDLIPETYSEWFEEQSDSDKRHILGRKRYENQTIC